MVDKIAPEVAEEEFNRFVEAFELDVKEDEDDKNSKKTLIKAICNGSLIFNDDCEPVYTPQREKSGFSGPIHFREPGGDTLLAMDRKKGEVGKMLVALEAMTGSTPGTFSKLKKKDLNVCIALAGFLLGG